MRMEWKEMEKLFRSFFCIDKRKEKVGVEMSCSDDDNDDDYQRVGAKRCKKRVE